MTVSLLGIRPWAMRLAPWTAAFWLIAVLTLFAQPCCNVIAAAGSGAQGGMASHLPVHHGQPSSGDDVGCKLVGATMHVVPGAASDVAAKVKVSPAFAPSVARAFPQWTQTIFPTLNEAGPPGRIPRVYLATQRLRI